MVGVSSVQAEGNFVGGGQTTVEYKSNGLVKNPDGKYEVVDSATIKKVPQTGVQISEKQTSEFFAISLVLLIILIMLYRKIKKQDLYMVENINK